MKIPGWAITVAVCAGAALWWLDLLVNGFSHLGLLVGDAVHVCFGQSKLENAVRSLTQDLVFFEQLLLRNAGNVLGECLPEKSNTGEVKDTVMHVHREHKTARYEEGLSSHCWCIALVEVYFALAVSWNAGIFCEIFRHKHRRLESTGWHAISFELLVGVWEVLLVVRDLLRSKYTTQMLACDRRWIVESKLTRFTVGQCESASQKGKFVECEAKPSTQRLDGILGEILIGKLRITSISVNTTNYSGEHTGKMHRVCM